MSRGGRAWRSSSARSRAISEASNRAAACCRKSTKSCSIDEAEPVTFGARMTEAIMARTPRRRVLQGAAASVVAMPFVPPFVHGAHAAGKLSVGFWDHWVPGGNEPLDKLCREWAAKEKVRSEERRVGKECEALWVR